MDLIDVQNLLIKHEGLKLKPYIDSVGKLTIGVGRNLDDNGITKEEALHLLYHDVCDAMTDAKRLCSIWDELSDARKSVLINMAFNMGYARLSQFVRFWNAIHKKDWDEAAEEMLASKWATQVKGRATELANMMKGNLL